MDKATIGLALVAMVACCGCAAAHAEESWDSDGSAQAVTWQWHAGHAHQTHTRRCADPSCVWETEWRTAGDVVVWAGCRIVLGEPGKCGPWHWHTAYESHGLLVILGEPGHGAVTLSTIEPASGP